MKYAAYCGTRNIYGDMETAAKSLIYNSDVDKVFFVIEDDEFPTELPPLVHCVNVSGQEFFKPDGPNMKSQYTYMAMMRIALCHVLPDVDRVLSLDCDTIVQRDASAVWDMPIDDCYFSATPEWHRSAHGLQYCNAGVTLFNLEKMRDGKADECIEVLNKHFLRWVEQDVANYLCLGRIHEMPAYYNGNEWTNHNNPDVVIKHYAGVPGHQWRNRAEVMHWRNMPWEEVMKRHGGS